MSSRFRATGFGSNHKYDGKPVVKSRTELSELKSDNDVKKAEAVTVVMGPTGVGKSRFIKEASGADIEVGDSLHSSTKTVQAYHFMLDKRSFALIDTPGFDDTVRSDAQVFRELAAWLAARYQERTRLTSILYIQRISDTRVSGGILRNLMVMKRMLGVENFPHLTLFTSMWDTVSSEVAELRELQLRDAFWSEFMKSGAHTGRFDGSQSSAHRILENIAKTGELSFTIQRELVDNRIPLARTTAGLFLSSEILRNNSAAAPDKQEGQIGTADQLEAEWDPDYGSLWLDGDVKTPWDASIYQPLGVDQFRLVKVFAGSGSMPLELAISCESFSDCPKYAALSYVVGKNQQQISVRFRTGEIVADRTIAENLHIALLHLRRETVNVKIWIDQLSINSNNTIERAQQVRLMSKIFSSAQNVCIWLGAKSVVSEVAFEMAEHILDLEKFEDALHKVDSGRGFEALTQLMASSWFTRRWCVQELLLAKSATVHCGTKVMKWTDFADAASLLATRWQDLQKQWAVSRFAQAEIPPAIALVDLSRNIVRRSETNAILEYEMDLETLLWRLVTFDVTVMHDTIYAIHDLAKDLVDKNKVPIDYDMEVVDLFRQVTEMIVKSSGSLDIICRPWAPLSGLPSWIPTVAKMPHRKLSEGHHFARQHGDLLVGAPGSRLYHACSRFSARGSTLFRQEGSQNILAVQGLKTGYVRKVGGECVNGNIPRRWMEMAGWKDIWSSATPEQFWRTLVADRDAQGSKAPNWYRRACETTFRRSQTPDVDTGRMLLSIKSKNVQEFIRRVQSIVWSRSLASIELIDHGDFSDTWERMSSQSKPHLCLCPSDIIEGDIIAVLYGCSVPVVLRFVSPYYQLIGECFVSGLMGGEALRDPKSFNRLDVFDLI